MPKKLFKQRINEILEKYKDKNVLLVNDISNFFGVESLGVWKIRGNGNLYLLRRRTFFWNVETEERTCNPN